MTQHTQGEWKATYQNAKKTGWAVQFQYGGGPLKGCYEIVAEYLTEDDARLIAAAPKLLEALDELVLKSSVDPLNIMALKQAKAALAAARGEA